MNELGSSDLFTLLTEKKILEPHQLEEVNASRRDGTVDSTNLVDELCRRGWLTNYQAERLRSGVGEGLVLGQYILIDLLGEGGMGQVFQARHRLMHRTVAIKTIRPEHARDAALPRFHREIRAMSQLIHPNVVIAHDADLIGETLFLVMEFVDGVDLSKSIKRYGPMPYGPACEVIRQAALGLQHAHEKGLVHRDIKPSNILLTADGRTVKVLDLGLARLRGSGLDEEKPLTQSNVVMGTPDYMAPEQARSAAGVDIRADIYSLGCTLYFLLAGRAPFGGNSFMEKLSAHAFDPAPSLIDARPDVPPEVEEIYQRMMAKDPDQRFETPIQLADALEPFCAPLRPPGHARPSSDEEVSGVHTPTPDGTVDAPRGPVTRGGDAHTKAGPPLARRSGPMTLTRQPSALGPRTQAVNVEPVLHPGDTVQTPAVKPPQSRLVPILTALVLLAIAGLGAAIAWQAFGGKPASTVAVTPTDSGPEVTKPAVDATKPADTKPVVEAKPKLVALVVARQGDTERLATGLEAIKQDGQPLLISKFAGEEPAGGLMMSDGLRRKLGEVASQCGEADTLLVIWGGDIRGQGETAGLVTTNGSVPLTEVYQVMGGSKARAKVLIAEVGNQEPPADPQKVTPPAGVTALFACAAGQKSERDRDGSSEFLRAVRVGLNQKNPLDEFVVERLGKAFTDKQMPQRVGRLTATPTLASLTGLMSEPAVVKVPVVEKPEEKPGDMQRVGEMTGVIQSLCFVGKSRLIAVVDRQFNLRLWDTEKLDVTAVQFREAYGLRWCVASSSDGKFIVTSEGGNYDEKGKVVPTKEQLIRTFDTKAGDLGVTWEMPTNFPYAVAIGAKDSYIAAGGSQAVVWTWDLSTKSVRAQFKEHKVPVEAIAFRNDGKIISGDRGGRVLFWDPTASNPTGRLVGSHPGTSISGLAYVDDSNVLLSAGRDGTIHISNDGDTPKEIKPHVKKVGNTETPVAVNGLAWVPKTTWGVSVGDDGMLRVWNSKDGKEIAAYQSNVAAQPLTCVAVSADGKFAVTGGTDKIIRVWRLPSPK